MRFVIIYVCLMLAGGFANAQSNNQLTIETCYTMARQNYPLVRQLELIDKSTGYNIQNAAKTFLPQIAINGQATYQSEVTQVPIKIPGMSVPEISKDQYKLYADINQSVYDGGMTRLQQQSYQASGDVEKQKVEIELYKLNGRINQLFFSILIIDEQLKQNELLKNDIQLGINRTEASIANGTALKSTANSLKAEMLKTDQHSIEMKATRKGYVDMLGLFINKTLEENTVLERPRYLPTLQDINRPELKLYDLQNKGLNIQDKMIKAKNLPKLNLFVQGGFGRPALNFLSNKFEPYYTTGLKVSWPITGSYSAKNDKALININRRSVDLQKETFLLNTKIVVKQENAEIAKLEKLLTTDDDIINLRTSVKMASFAQLENGVITSNDYLREINAEDQARQSRILHDIQLLMAHYNNQTTTGN